MRNLKLSILIVLSSFYLQGQTIPDCEDSNPFSIVTDCGTQIDLCIDRYVMGSDEREKELKIFSNDSGIIDPCASYICVPCSHGTLERLENCSFKYRPEPGFVGMDTFYYALVMYDTCMMESYCEKDDGKIWSIQSIYTGPDNGNIEVYSNEANEWKFVDDARNLNSGDYFWIDGSHLPVSQTNWEYRVFLPGNSNPQTTIVHTSCSQDVLGKDFGYFRTIAGCIAPQYDKEQCNINEEYRYQLDARSSYIVSTRFEEVTMVIIEVLNALAIDYTDFNVIAHGVLNKISWTLDLVTNNDFIELEKSYDGLVFFSIKTFNNTTAGFYEFLDPMEPGVSKYYYRLAIIDEEGNKRYSQIISISNQLHEEMVSVFPNPVMSTFQISAENSAYGIIKYEIWDTNGKLITRVSTEPTKHITCTTKELIEFNGVYLLNIVLANGQNIATKVISLNPVQ